MFHVGHLSDDHYYEPRILEAVEGGCMTKTWKIRAKNYDNLAWVKNETYLDRFVKIGKFKKKDVVLDIGTGTGIIAHSISPLVKKVIGIDNSQYMFRNSKQCDNVYFVEADVLDFLFNDNVFDKITARMVFHHILERTQDAMDECYRMLKKGGKMILAEGTPPNKEVREDFIKIFKLKEDRITFYEEDLIALMENSGFKNIKLENLWLRQMSIRNWLCNSSLPKKTRDKIFDLHVNAKDYFKKAYNMSISGGDCFIDMKIAILVGEK